MIKAIFYTLKEIIELIIGATFFLLIMGGLIYIASVVSLIALKNIEITSIVILILIVVWMFSKRVRQNYKKIRSDKSGERDNILLDRSISCYRNDIND